MADTSSIITADIKVTLPGIVKEYLNTNLLNKNPYNACRKNIRAATGRPPDADLPTDVSMPIATLPKGVEFDTQYRGNRSKFDRETVSFLDKTTNKSVLSNADLADLGSTDGVLTAMATHAKGIIDSTIPGFETQVITNKVMELIKPANILTVKSADLTENFVYAKTRGFVTALVAKGHESKDLVIVMSESCNHKYMDAANENTYRASNFNSEILANSVYGIPIRSTSNLNLYSKFEWKLVEGNTEKTFEPTDDAKKVWFIVAPAAAIYWDVAETTVNIGNEVNSPFNVVNLMHRMGATVRTEYRDHIYAIQEDESATVE